MTQYRFILFLLIISLSIGVTQAGYSIGYDEGEYLEAQAGDIIETYILFRPYEDCVADLSVSDNLQPYTDLPELKDDAKTWFTIHSDEPVDVSGELILDYECSGGSGNADIQRADDVISLKVRFLPTPTPTPESSSGSSGGGVSGGKIVVIPTEVVATKEPTVEQTREPTQSTTPTPTSSTPTPTPMPDDTNEKPEETPGFTLIIWFIAIMISWRLKK